MAPSAPSATPRVLHGLIFLALGSIALAFTWTLVMQWVFKYEFTRHAALFASPLRWPELFGKCFSDFMIKDGGVNEAGNFLMSSLAGPTLCFMLYATVSSFRIRAAQGNYSLAILESVAWVLLDGLVAPSTALAWYFAYRAFGVLQQPRKAEDDASNTADSSVATIQPPLRSRRSGSSGLLLSVLLSLAYAGIVYAAVLFAWRHLAQATASSVLDNVTDVWHWANKDGHQSTLHRFITKTQANPITKNLLFDLAFTNAAIALHTTLSLQARIGGVVGWLVLLLTPAVYAANVFTAGSVWIAFLIANELGIFGLSGGASTASSSKQAKSKKTQ